MEFIIFIFDIKKWAGVGGLDLRGPFPDLPHLKTTTKIFNQNMDPHVVFNFIIFRLTIFCYMYYTHNYFIVLRNISMKNIEKDLFIYRTLNFTPSRTNLWLGLRDNELSRPHFAKDSESG